MPAPEAARKREAPRAKRVAEPGDDFAPKDLAQHLHREKEGRPRVDPPRAVGRQAARGHDAVDVRMMQQALSPGVEDDQTADRGAEALRVAPRPAGASPQLARNSRS